MIFAATALLSACTSLTEGYAHNWAGFQGRDEMCKAARRFVRSPLSEEGLRRVWFLSLGNYADGSSYFYSPMQAAPSDEHSSAL